MDDKSINILLVEDDAVDVMTVQRAFKKGKVANPLHVAGNGLEALDLLRAPGSPLKGSRCVILLDLNMPKMNGIEFLTQLRQDPDFHKTPVIVLTTSDQERDRVEAYNLHVAGYILKPVTFSKFVEVITVLNHYWTLCEFP
ncbi:response regulator [Leptolyngbya cf. ectocarpi LEGE 11479]|uniref:Response regulator n=1 Tax=Leptolyngbya cf. ectocarpi LEGE 11479 TaxID=1828722 RepID=A0A928X1H2_LEPEC|nr:response regulator [Leptolyngbya ectocarpi]MBE9065268.1 response regulator [Leptolyngbya cf. ectocarpi LEGE 11479]